MRRGGGLSLPKQSVFVREDVEDESLEVDMSVDVDAYTLKRRDALDSSGPGQDRVDQARAYGRTRIPPTSPAVEEGEIQAAAAAAEDKCKALYPQGDRGLFHSRRRFFLNAS